MNKTIENMLRGYVNNHLNDWDDHLVAAEIAINNAVQDSTGFSPYFLTYGADPNFPLTEAARATEHRVGINETARDG